MNSLVTKPSGNQKPILGILFSLMAVAVSLIVVFPIANRLDPIVGDLIISKHQAARSQSAEEIVVVAITEETLAGLPYRSPIDRRFMADLIKTIDAASPKAIGLDILLDTPSEPDKDAELLSALNAAKAPIILANAAPDTGLTEKQTQYLAKLLENRLAGSILLQRDQIDGVMRHVPYLEDTNGSRIRTFTDVIADPETTRPNISGRILFQSATDVQPRAFPTYPAHTIGLIPSDWFTQKYVLIGTDLPFTDRHRTPMGTLFDIKTQTMSGIEIHAHILNQRLQNRSLPVLSGWQNLAALTLGALVAAIGFGLISSPARFFACILALTGIYIIAAYSLATNELVLLPIAGPIAATGSVAFLLSLVRWWQDRNQRKFLETAFSKYVSKNVVTRIANGTIKLTLGGEKREVTYLFTDLEGFTSLSESLPADQTGKLLNTYLDEMCGIITDHGATIDKIIGDAVVCFFGAPDADADHAAKGVRLAIALDEFCERYRSEVNRAGLKLGATRIGVHTGEAVIGNFGGTRFFDYTGIGDTVNVAARLEGANRYLGTRICISQSTAESSKDINFRPLGALQLKGRRSPISCFQPCSEEQYSASWMKKYLTAFEQMTKQNPNAIKSFMETETLNPEDGPTKFHLARLKEGQLDEIVILSDK